MSVLQVPGLVQQSGRDLNSRGGSHALDVVLILLRDRYRILLITSIAGLVGLCIAFCIAPRYTATTTLLPPREQQSSIAAMLGQLGSLASLTNTGGLLKNPADTYVAMITSRTAADDLIGRFHLKRLYGTGKMDDARHRLESQITAEAGKDGLIHVNVTDKDPNRASELANGLVDELYQLTSTLAISEASKRRAFFDKQVQEEKSALTAAEEDLKATQEKTGVIQLNGQTEESIRNVASLRAQVISLRVEMQSMRMYATDQNPEMTRLQERLAALQEQLATAESSQRNMQVGDLGASIKQMPEAGLEYVRKLREVTYHTTLLNLLTEEYEAARIDEAKSAPMIQVVDRAVPPDHKSGPSRLFLTLGFVLLGFCFACFRALFAQALAIKRGNPESAAKLDELSKIIHLRI